MKKAITIPRGYDPNNNDIGNHNLVSGFNYQFWYAYVGDIKDILSESTYNMGQLCKSVNINKWAAFKPTRFQVPTDPRHYHGFFLDLGEPAPSDIIYQKPRGGEPGGAIDEPYCIDHFLGYNHNATPPAAMLVNIYFDANGDYGNLICFLPEFDLRTVSANIEGVIAEVYVGASLQKTVFAAFNDGNIENRSLTISDFLTLSGSSNVNYSVKLFLGREQNNVKYTHYPTASGGAYELFGTAVYLTPPVIILDLDDSDYAIEEFSQFIDPDTADFGFQFMVKEILPDEYVRGQIEFKELQPGGSTGNPAHWHSVGSTLFGDKGATYFEGTFIKNSAPVTNDVRVRGYLNLI